MRDEKEGLAEKTTTDQPPLEILRQWYLHKAASGQGLNRGELLALLADWYELAGEWLRPPEFAMPANYQGSGQAQGPDRQMFPTDPRQLTTANRLNVLDPWESPRHDYQPPMPGVARPVLLPQRPPETVRATGFDYNESVYRRAAEQLLGEATEVSPWLREGIAKTLAVMLAWCNHPLFMAMGGRWMTLGSKRFCRELGVKNDLLQVYIAELQRLGLLIPGFARQKESSLYPQVHFITPEDYAKLKGHLASLPVRYGGGPGGYLNSRAVQMGSTFYKLKEGVVCPILPVFNPFGDTSQPVVAPQGHFKPVMEYPPRSQYKALKLGGGEEISIKKVSVRAYKAKKAVPHYSQTKEQLENQRKEKFLTEFHGQFAPFKFDPLHPSVIEEFVANYDLPLLMQKYRQLRDDWAEGRANFTNPVGIYVSRVRDMGNATYRLAPEQEQAIRAELARRRGQHKQTAPPKSAEQNPAAKPARAKSGGLDFSKYTQPGGKYYHLTSGGQVVGVGG